MHGHYLVVNCLATDSCFLDDSATARINITGQRAGAIYPYYLEINYLSQTNCQLALQLKPSSDQVHQACWQQLQLSIYWQDRLLVDDNLDHLLDQLVVLSSSSKNQHNLYRLDFAFAPGLGRCDLDFDLVLHWSCRESFSSLATDQSTIKSYANSVDQGVGSSAVPVHQFQPIWLWILLSILLLLLLLRLIHLLTKPPPSQHPTSTSN